MLLSPNKEIIWLQTSENHLLFAFMLENKVQFFVSPIIKIKPNFVGWFYANQIKNL